MIDEITCYFCVECVCTENILFSFLICSSFDLCCRGASVLLLLLLLLILLNASMGCKLWRRLQPNIAGLQKCSLHSSSMSHWDNSPSPSERSISVPKSFQSHVKKTGGLPAEILQKRAARLLRRQLEQQVLWEGTSIDDPQHHLIQHFLELSKNPKYRNSKKMMCIGGEHMIRELCAQNHYPDHLLLPKGHKVPSWIPSSTKVVAVSRGVMNQEPLSGSDGYVGDFRIPSPPAKEELIANKMLMNRVLVLDNVADPGNLGTILRTSVGFHYDAVVLTNHCADLYDHRVVRAARGAQFQASVPIYSLKEEDGDDVYGMLNHIISRNSLSPVLLVSEDGAGEPPAGASSSDFPFALPEWEFKPSTAQKISDFCFEHFTTRRKPSDGLMVFLSPDYKRTAERRLAHSIQKNITTLVLDCPVSNFLSSASIALHALRPSGSQGYLPATQEKASSMELQTQRSAVDLGPDRLVLGFKDLNLDEDEQMEQAQMFNEYKQWKRSERRRASDYDHWMSAETDRIGQMFRGFRKKMEFPWQSAATRPRQAPSWVPNILDEYRQPLDRDALRMTEEEAKNFTRPSNYKQ